MTEKKITKGMVLAAGLGTRLLPITEKFPKPLVPVLNVPNILHSLNLLKRAGIREVIINLHHLPHLIEDYLGDGSRWGMRIAYSKETTLLGTGGGLKKAERFFEGGPLVLVNCDFISDVHLQPIIERHLERDALATMVLHEDPELQPFYSKVGTDAHGNLCRLPSCETKTPARTGLFTGIHVLANACLRYLKETPSGINEVLYPALMKEHPQRVFAEMDGGAYWYDTGERTTLWNASMKLLGRLQKGDKVLRDFLAAFGGYEEAKPGIWAVSSDDIPSHGALTPPLIIGRKCRVGKNVRLGPNSLIGDGCIVDDGAHVTNFVALGAAHIPGGKISEDALQFQELTLPAKR